MILGITVFCLGVALAVIIFMLNDQLQQLDELTMQVYELKSMLAIVDGKVTLIKDRAKWADNIRTPFPRK